MNKLSISIIIPFICAFALHGAEIVFQPQYLYSEIGIWKSQSGEYKGERFRDFSYKNSGTVFRVLDRLTPNVERLIESAKEQNATIVLENNGTTFFDSSRQIKQSFRIQPPPSRFVDLDPASLKLIMKYSSCWGRKEYWLNLAEDADSIKITKQIYDELVIAKISAQGSHKLIHLDSIALTKENSKSASVSLVERSVEKHVCIICSENEKCIMLEPCHHAVLCEDCATKIKKKCPICRNDFTKKVKIYI